MKGNVMSRGTFNWIFGTISGLLALVSLYAALPASSLFGLSGKGLGRVLVALWVLGPPVFFWVDWVVFCRDLSKDEKDAAKHTHDLSRNIWLALVAVLAVAFNLTDKFS